jgi:hypothetical protein
LRPRELLWRHLTGVHGSLLGHTRLRPRLALRRVLLRRVLLRRVRLRRIRLRRVRLRRVLLRRVLLRRVRLRQRLYVLGRVACGRRIPGVGLERLTLRGGRLVRVL